jgi:hypothetical protein
LREKDEDIEKVYNERDEASQRATLLKTPIALFSAVLKETCHPERSEGPAFSGDHSYPLQRAALERAPNCQG